MGRPAGPVDGSVLVWLYGESANSQNRVLDGAGVGRMEQGALYVGPKEGTFRPLEGVRLVGERQRSRRGGRNEHRL